MFVMIKTIISILTFRKKNIDTTLKLPPSKMQVYKTGVKLKICIDQRKNKVQIYS